MAKPDVLLEQIAAAFPRESVRNVQLLLWIGQHEPAKQADLGGYLKLPVNALSMLLVRLRSNQWITSEPAPGQHQARLLRLTPKARAALKKAGLL